ncbi:MAG: DUF4445 domain-containing protein [Methanomicrobiales archaeon]|nr:DUF4445 domain-containing protein [Methanomicrobiales archaeon]
MPQNVPVIFHPLNKMVTVPRGTSVMDAIRLAGIQFESICGGKGECNKCKVIFVRGECDIGSPETIKGLSADEIARNYCRACQTHILGNAEFIIPVESRIDAPKILHHYAIPALSISPSAKKYRLLLPPPGSHPVGQRSVKLDGYSGTRPHMSRQQHDSLLAATGTRTVTVSQSRGYPEIIRIDDSDTTGENYGVAIDLGTTTVVGVLVDLVRGTVCAEATGLNRQITHGEELLTRIAATKKPGGKEQLRLAAVASINEVIEKLIAAAGISVTSINDVCIAGNTVMHYLFLGRDAGVLEIANVEVPREPVILKAHTAGLLVNPEASVYCLPDVSRFIGGDAVGDVVASGMHLSSDLSLLVDLGTNGEVILGSRDWLASVSCASGPAFEGAGITCGMRAMRGAIDHVTIDPASGAVSFTTIAHESPRGICGSGIIDAAAAMVKAGILDFSGRFVDGKPGVRQGEDGPEYVLVHKERTATGRDIVITRQDLIYLMDSKAAACGAIGVLMKKYRIGIHDIRQVYLAGGFGEYADREKLVMFGIIPAFPHAEFHAIGNGSLAGACACLLSQAKRAEAEATARTMVYIDLLIDADFIEEYTAALYIPGKKEYFP